MAPRAFWTGYLRLSLVNIPVRLYTATSSERSIAFHQIHEPTGERIRYQKIAPSVGPVENEEITKGYEYEKGKYVLIDPKEIDELYRDLLIGVTSFFRDAEDWAVLADEIVPELVYQLGLLWFLAGIPAAVLIGWHHGEKGKQKAPVSEVLIIVGLLLLVGGFSGVRVVDEVSRRGAIAAARESALDLDRVAVLYFDDLSPDDEFRHLADALTESLIEEFARVRNLDVVSRNGVAEFRGADVPPDSIAAALQAGLVCGLLGRATAHR